MAGYHFPIHKLRLASEVRQRIARSMHDASDPYLYCNVCDFTRKLTFEESVECLANGWPQHCDQTMFIRTGPPEAFAE